MKLAFLDIESTNLYASVGIILCASVKFTETNKIDGPVKHVRIDQSPDYKKGGVHQLDDTVCILGIKKWLVDEDPDIVITYNGIKFDIPYIETRLAKLQEKPLPDLTHVDYFRVVINKLRMHSMSLDALADYLEVPHQKTHYRPEVWKRAEHGDKKSMDLIVEHCDLDVQVLQDCHNRLRGLVRPLARALLRGGA